MRIVALGLFIEAFFIPRYLAPATGLIYAILLQCMPLLRVRGSTALAKVRAIALVCVLLAVVSVNPLPRHIALQPGLKQTASWDGGGPNDRSKVGRARDTDAAGSRELLNHFKNRTAWLGERDQSRPRVVPYPVADAKAPLNASAAPSNRPTTKPGE